MRQLSLGFALFLVVAVWSPISAAWAQSTVGMDTCTTFRAATDPGQKALYLAYLQGYADANSPDPRYPPTDAQLADSVKKIRDWCGRNTKSSYSEAVYAVLGSYVRHVLSAPQAPPQSLDPTSCRVGPTNYCAGCSVSCPGGKQATCHAGTDNPFGKSSCTFQSKCSCKLGGQQHSHREQESCSAATNLSRLPDRRSRHRGSRLC